MFFNLNILADHFDFFRAVFFAILNHLTVCGSS